jgi:hypothetical protein
MDPNLVHENLEGFFPSQKTCIKDVHRDQFSKVVSKALIWNQQETRSVHLLDVCM